MKRILTTLAAAVLATALTTPANAGHMVHHDQPHHDQPQINNKLIVPTNKLVTNQFVATGNNGKTLHVHEHRDRLRPSDSGDFRYCCWLPHRHCYTFWCAADDCWYYWYAPWDCYLPYEQISSCPPEANVVPQIPGGLPPVVAGGDPGPSQDAPPMPPTDDAMNAP